MSEAALTYYVLAVVMDGVAGLKVAKRACFVVRCGDYNLNGGLFLAVLEGLSLFVLGMGLDVLNRSKFIKYN